MKSKMSFFDPTLLKKNVSRFAPAWAILILAFFLSLPLPLIRLLSGWSDSAEALKNNVQRILGEDVLPLGFVFAFFAGPLFAVLVFKYLHRTRDAYMMHAFPMTRSCQFVTNTVSGLLFWLVPTLFIGLCTLGILAVNGIGGCGGLVWVLLGKWLLAFLCFYGIAVLAMHISGNTVIAVMSCGALNFMFLVVPLMILLLARVYFRGFDFVITEKILRLSPFVELMAVDHREPFMLWVYGGVGLILLVLSWVLYRCRSVERAGDAMVFPWARIAFRLLFTLCVSLGLGWILAAFFGMIADGGGVFLPYALIGCVLGWFGSSMMVERTVKVFKNKKVWLGLAACAGVLILTVGCLKYDLLGFQRRIPETAGVASVEIWTAGGYDDLGTDKISLTEPEDIDVVRRFQSAALEQYEYSSGFRNLFSDSLWGELHIVYHLKDGGTLRRAYDVPEDQYASLSALYTKPEIAAAWYEKALPEDFRRVTLYGVIDYERDIDGTECYSGEEIPCRNPAALKAAVLADAGAGRLPIMNFLTRGDYFDGKEMIQRDYYELYLSYELGDRNGWPDRILQICIASGATETMKLFLP